MFAYPALLWALPVAAVVVLIHLINMFRHRRVEWAAFEFLLAGYKKSRTRIFLQQLLLLLLRVFAVLAIVLMLAQPRLYGPIAGMFGGERPRLHLILLDDSFSMSDRVAGDTVFDDALATVGKILEQQARSGRERFSLIRFSQAKAVESGKAADFEEFLLDEAGSPLARERIRILEPSESSAGPEEALAAAVAQLPELTAKYRCVVDLVSDFRLRDWEQTEPLAKLFAQIKNQGAAIRLIRTVDSQHPNLAIRQVKTVEGIHAAEVPILLEATVVNFGTRPVENVRLGVALDGRSHSSPNIPIIAPEKEATVRFPVRVAGGGPHKVQLQLEPDAVAADNRYSLVLDVPQEIAVLLIVPDLQDRAVPDQADSFLRRNEPETDSEDSGAVYLRTAIAPEGVRTGVRVQTESPAFLSSHPLERFDVVVLLDVPPLELSAVRSLESCLASGGGGACLFGQATEPMFVNEKLYRKGEGCFPVALFKQETLLPDYLTRRPDWTLAEHPMFRVFEKSGSPLLNTVRIERYFSVEPTATAAAGNGSAGDGSVDSKSSPAKTLGTLRNGAPLILEKEFGRGRTLAFLTTAAPVWNDWARGNPSFVITMLEMIAYLSRNRGEQQSGQVGQPIEFEFDPNRYENAVRIIPPVREPVSESTSEPTSDRERPEPVLAVSPAAASNLASPIVAESRPNASGRNVVRVESTERSGFYEAWLSRRGTEGSDESRLFAVNVDFAEGNLAIRERTSLSEMLRPLGLSVEDSARFGTASEFESARSLDDWLLFVVIALLGSELFLAGRLLPPAK